MTERMKRLSAKKEERKRRENDYEHSSASSNIDRDGLTAYSSPDKAMTNTYISSQVALGNST